MCFHVVLKKVNRILHPRFCDVTMAFIIFALVGLRRLVT